jgi:farnesyl-diphosphate farnesyltransferase
MNGAPPSNSPSPAQGGDAPDLAQLLRATSRTFAIGIENLPDGLRETVRTAYLLLRVSDYLEDSVELSPAIKARLLGLWVDVIGGIAELDELEEQFVDVDWNARDAIVLRNLRPILSALTEMDSDDREIVLRNVTASTLGMRRWVERGPDFLTEADLDDYMHEVAGRVGGEPLEI